MTLYMTPPNLPLAAASERNLSSSSVSASLDTSTSAGFLGNKQQTTNQANKGTAAVLYKTLSPRKKIDRFGLDQTDYKAYCLSTTVFPTAVKTTLLSELHETNPHTNCGFDIVERPTADTTIRLSPVPSCATSVINAPPPTAVTSQRSTQSAPIVAFVQVPSAEMPVSRAARHPSAATGGSKSTATSQVFSDTGHGQDTDQQYHTHINIVDNNENVKDERDDKKQQRDGNSAPRSSFSSLHGNSIMSGDNSRFLKKRFDLPPKGSGKKQQSSAVVQSYARFDESRLIQYQWKSRQTRVEEDKKDGGDIRDTMYLNTFCPEERPVRFNKISLPRISRGSRQRPWTVSESKLSARSALAMLSKSNHGFSRVDKTSLGLQRSQQTPLRGVLKNGGGGPSGGVTKSAGHIKLGHEHAWREQAVIDANHDNNNIENTDIDGDKENDDDRTLGSKPLLEIRSFLSNSALGDQREKLKGKNGCLNSRVKQCVRFVRYRERLDKHEDNRPLKSEHGKYRPFSKTDVRDHNPSNPAPTPELKLQQSVETYQQYVENIARQTNFSSPKPNFSFRAGGGGGGGGGGSSNLTTGHSKSRPGLKFAAGSSINFDLGGDSTTIGQLATLDSSRPADGVLGSSSRHPSETPRPKNSAIYTKDVSAVGQALDIKRISPVATVNRVVPGTRGVIQWSSNSPRVLSASNNDEEEGGAADVDDVITPLSPGQHGDTIVVPMASKSECLSEYSKDD